MNFNVDGDFFTDFIKNLCLEPNIKKAWIAMEKTFLGLDQKIIKDAFIRIIRGKAKFIGINDFELVNCSEEYLLPKLKRHIYISRDRNELKELEKYFVLNYKVMKKNFQSLVMESQFMTKTKNPYLFMIWMFMMII